MPLPLLGALALGGGGALASFLGSRGSSDDLDAVLRQLGTQATQQTEQGQDLLDLGTSSLQPALRFLTAITRGDAGAIGSVTRPERTRVLDQYDAARQSVAQFTPRGGGQTSAISTSFTDEANTLSNIFATGRREGATALSQVGAGLTRTGAGTTASGTQSLGSLVQAFLNQDAQARQSSGGFGEALGSLAGLLLFAPQGKQTQQAA